MSGNSSSAVNTSVNNGVNSNNGDRQGMKPRGNHKNGHVTSQKQQYQHQDSKQQIQLQSAKLHEDNNVDSNQETQSNPLHNQMQQPQTNQTIDTNAAVQQHDNPSNPYYHFGNSAVPCYQPYDGNQSNYPFYQYPVPANGAWQQYCPSMNPTMNPTGYVYPGSQMSYAIPAVLVPQIWRRDLFQWNDRINTNANYSVAPNGSDLPKNDTHTLRFFYNLGIENYKNFQCVYGNNALRAIFDGNFVLNDQPQQATVVEKTEIPNRMVDEFQQLNLEGNEVESQTSSKETESTDTQYGSQRGSSVKYKRENKLNTSPRYYGTYPGPTSKIPNYYKNSPRNTNWDAKPIKESQQNLGQQHQSFGRYAPPSLYRPQFSAPPTVPFRDGAGNDVSDAAYPRYYKKYPYSQTTNSPYYPDSNQQQGQAYHQPTEQIPQSSYSSNASHVNDLSSGTNSTVKPSQ